MRVMLLVHILAGSLGILSGFAALFAAKGAAVHRRAGVVFVSAMLTMGISGAGMAAIQGAEASVIAGGLAAYLVATAMATVRPGAAESRRLNAGALLVALTLGLASLGLAAEARSLGGAREGIPMAALVMFATIALLGAAGDARVLRTGPRRGAPRLARHLWRMCIALYIASTSFFLGQADEIPQALRIPLLLAVLAFTPLLVVPYWLWRVRARPVAAVPRAAGAGRGVRRAPAHLLTR